MKETKDNPALMEEPPPLQTEQVVVEKVAQPNPITVHDGALTPSNSSELNRTIANIAKGGGFPTRFETSAQQIAAYNLAHSLMGGRWQLALNNIAIIKGQMAIYGELPGALAEQTKEVEEKEVFVLDVDYKRICVENKNLSAAPHVGVCLIKRKGRAKKEFTYTMDEATKAGQYPATRRDGSLNNDSPWMKFTKVMLMRKAMALAIKFEFADAMIGTPVCEYDFDVMPDNDGKIKDVTPMSNKAELVNSGFGPSKAAVVEETVQQ